MKLEVLPNRFAICRFGPHDAVPAWADGSLTCIARTTEELSVLCSEASIPDGVPYEGDWRVMKFAGPLDFAMVGVLASVAAPLGEAGIPILAVSTYDTDYVLVKQASLERAAKVLAVAGHEIAGG
jgi:hypothetical protein